VLSEYVGIVANVAQGHTGSASASFDTQTPQAFSYTVPALAGSSGVAGSLTTSTSLSGALSVNVAKTSKEGSAQAFASMSANSGLTDLTAITGLGTAAKVGASSRLYANESLSGVGSALAQVSKATATGYTTVNDLNYSKSSAAGDIKLTASNVDNDAIAQNGGNASGWADISAASYMLSSGSGSSQAIERMKLNATRGQSFSGTSYADGYLNGQETAESSWVNGTNSARSIGNNNKTVVDLESTSQITGSVVAHNIRDTSGIDAGLMPVVSTIGATLGANSAKRGNGNATASNDWFDRASVTRDTPIGINSTQRAEANAYMPIATWQGAASYVSPMNTKGQFLASIAGNQGLSWDGLPAKNPGFGVGAWIQHAYNQPQIATMEATQTASTVGAGTQKTTFLMHLDGMKAITLTQNDAVGAFGGVANQAVATKNQNATTTLTLDNVNAINWLVGDDANPIPGISQGKYYPSNMVISFPNPSAIQRIVELSYP
jgi:hypothetical protein